MYVCIMYICMYVYIILTGVKCNYNVTNKAFRGVNTILNEGGELWRCSKYEELDNRKWIC